MKSQAQNQGDTPSPSARVPAPGSTSIPTLLPPQLVIRAQSCPSPARSDILPRCSSCPPSPCCGFQWAARFHPNTANTHQCYLCASKTAVAVFMHQQAQSLETRAPPLEFCGMSDFGGVFKLPTVRLPSQTINERLLTTANRSRALTYGRYYARTRRQAAPRLNSPDHCLASPSCASCPSSLIASYADTALYLLVHRATLPLPVALPRSQRSRVRFPSILR